MKKKRVFIVGLAGHNLGDDAIALSAWSVLGEKYEVRVSSVNKGRLTRYGISEVYLNRKSPLSMFRVVRAMLWADVLLVGGGGLIQDRLGYGFFKGVLGFTNQITFLAKKLGLKICSLPIGVDRLNHVESVSLANSIISRFDKLCVRDEISASLVQKYCPAVKAVSVMGDPAYLIGDFISQKKNHDSYVVISLVKENLEINCIVDVIASYVDYVLKNSSLRVKLVCMDTRLNDEYELYTIIKNKCIDDRVEIVIEESLVKVCRLIWGAHHIIAMRLHAMIIGLGYAPIFCLSRTTKTETFCSDNGVPFFDLSDDVIAKKLVDFYSHVVASSDDEVNLFLNKRQKLVEKIRIDSCI